MPNFTFKTKSQRSAGEVADNDGKNNCFLDELIAIIAIRRMARPNLIANSSSARRSSPAKETLKKCSIEMSRNSSQLVKQGQVALGNGMGNGG